MTHFATEFPVRQVPHPADFVAQATTWLRGIKDSSILMSQDVSETGGDIAHLRSPSGEELRWREFGRNGTSFEALGFRHDLPDVHGRLWRTEAVIRRNLFKDNQDLIRLRTQCIATRAGARLEVPRKPYLLKSILVDGWGGMDGLLEVSDKPHWLGGGEADLGLACAITLGRASTFLPVIYVSAIEDGVWLLSRSEIEKLSYDLGGVAHVVVEPSRAFSFDLRTISSGKNSYGGTLGVSLPGHGIVRKFYLGVLHATTPSLIAELVSFGASLRTQMPSNGWDWTDIQEEALKLQRRRDRNRVSVSELTDLYEEEIDNLKDKINQLELKISELREKETREIREPVRLDLIFDEVGPEIYNGEFLDRLRMMAKECMDRVDQIGLDNRSKIFLEKFCSNLTYASDLEELRAELKRAERSGGAAGSNFVRLLVRVGYWEKAEKKHIRLEPRPEMVGLSSVTLLKTPSDGRSWANTRLQIERSMGLSKLR